MSTNPPYNPNAIATNSLTLLASRGEVYDRQGGERSMLRTMLAFNIITGKMSDEMLNKLVKEMDTMVTTAPMMDEAEGWLFMQILKDVRQWTTKTFQRDSGEDCVAYALLKTASLHAKERRIDNYTGTSDAE